MLEYIEVVVQNLLQDYRYSLPTTVLGPLTLALSRREGSVYFRA
jgi:hypothetical protein